MRCTIRVNQGAGAGHRSTHGRSNAQPSGMSVRKIPGCRGTSGSQALGGGMCRPNSCRRSPAANAAIPAAASQGVACFTPSKRWRTIAMTTPYMMASSRYTTTWASVSSQKPASPRTARKVTGSTMKPTTEAMKAHRTPFPKANTVRGKSR